MFTKKEPVTGTVYIWAVPRSTYEFEFEENPNLSPFRYEIMSNTPWQNGAVRVSEHEVTLVVPAGVNLLAAAVETLELRKKEAMDTYARAVREIDEQISNLMRLSGPSPDTDALEGEIPDETL